MDIFNYLVVIMRSSEIILRQNPVKTISLAKAAKSCNSFAEFKLVVYDLDEKTRYQLALQRDSDFMLPIEIIKKREELNKYEQEAIFKWLLKYTLPNQYKKLNEKIDADEIIKRYEKKLPESRLKNIRIAAEILNKVREKIQFSRTAPETNFFSRIKIQSIDAQIVEMHKLMNIEFRKKESQYEDEYPQISDEKFNLDIAQLRLYVEYYFASKFGLGNCEDYSYAACYYAQTQYHLSSAVLALHPGDHVVAILDNDVIIDAWSCDIYLKEDKDHFYDYQSIKDSSNFEWNIVLPANSSQQWVTKASFLNKPSSRVLSFFPLENREDSSPSPSNTLTLNKS